MKTKHRQNITDTYLGDMKTTSLKAINELLKHVVINEDDAISIERSDDLVKNIKLIKNWVGDKRSKEGNDVLLDFEVKLDAAGKSRFFKIKHGKDDEFFSIYLYDENKKGKSLLSITKEGKVICDDIRLYKSLIVGDKQPGKVTTQELVVNNIYGKTTDNKIGEQAVNIDEKGNVTFRENVVFKGVISSEANKFPADGGWHPIKKNIQQFDLYKFYCSSMHTDSKRNHLSEFLISIGQRPDEDPAKSYNPISRKHHFYTWMNNFKFLEWLMPSKKWNSVQVEIQRHRGGIAICAKADPKVEVSHIYYSIQKLWDRKLFNEPAIAPRPRPENETPPNTHKFEEPSTGIKIIDVKKKNQVS